ncbi:MAG: hypothetical protein HC855_16735 [Rhizobiales bacterium]|nr:hypothetical protein [Hyphomicrobiales bacterium]
MNRRRKAHPADIAATEILGRAIRFDVALFFGTGRYATTSATALECAMVEASRLAAEYPGSRRPMINGITAEDRSALATT